MSIVSLANVCAHLQNVSMARAPLASIPYTRLHLNIALGLHKEGFISSLQRGSQNGPDITPVEVTPDNISTRRLWLGMKYRQGKPVLSKFQLISKPNRRVYANAEDLQSFASGNRFRFVKPVMPGEIVFVRPRGSKEVINLHEAVKKHVDGELLCRVF
ncbi:mitochondrial 37S ribosomal protein [Pichia kluyveri]|uniref:Mitochondrial 37S ribosomal protein n=1 Tax=Pichia kluyveri TaxID=36015 RepID=A0AAV5R0B5_PICKL|nr:mitochondrial 37S ribosomal protein [Pichia kluyveri]